MTNPLLFRILRHDYEEIDNLCATLAAATTRVDRERLRDRLIEETGKLFAAEESVVYSALMRAGTVPDVVERMLQQHGHLRQALKRSRVTRPTPRPSKTPSRRCGACSTSTPPRSNRWCSRMRSRTWRPTWTRWRSRWRPRASASTAPTASDSSASNC